MDKGRMKPIPMLFPAMGSPKEIEIRRMELDEAQYTRAEDGRGRLS